MISTRFCCRQSNHHVFSAFGNQRCFLRKQNLMLSKYYEIINLNDLALKHFLKVNIKLKKSNILHSQIFTIPYLQYQILSNHTQNELLI